MKTFAKSENYQPDLLEVWDRQLLHNGPYIYQKRKEFIRELIPIFQDYYERVSSGREKIGLEYQSQLHENSLEDLLRDHAEKDRILYYTTAGTHKDDLQMTLDAYPIKRIGSQGQQKTFLVALKLAKFEFIRKVNGFHPVLLLDDIFDKFDVHRVEQIIKLVADQNFGQIFITDTNRERIGKILSELTIEYKLFHVDDGSVIEKTE